MFIQDSFWRHGRLVPAIHVFISPIDAAKTWMPGTRPGMTRKGLLTFIPPSPLALVDPCSLYRERMDTTTSATTRLTDAQRLDWLRLIRSDNIGPRGIMAQTPPGSENDRGKANSNTFSGCRP